jgi:hypothetical protein
LRRAVGQCNKKDGGLWTTIGAVRQTGSLARSAVGQVGGHEGEQPKNFGYQIDGGYAE